MHRGTSLALLCLGLFLVVFPLALNKPGLPMTLKADEPAYYLMALSLARDGDLLCETGDLARLFDEYPYFAVFNLILMTDDGWHTIFFGKPFIYSLFAAPAAGFFGANGLVAFNMLLLLGMVWMGTVYLGTFNPRPLAALFSAGFFLLSSSFAYVFWLQPEIFNMFCVTASLFLVFKKAGAGATTRGARKALDRWLLGAAAAPAWSGALLAFAVYNKPMLAALGVPSLALLASRRRWRQALIWILAAAISLAAVCGLSMALTGHPSAYLGVERMGVKVFDPQQLPVEPQERAPEDPQATRNSWHWLWRMPDVDWAAFGRSLGYFLWGRHTGLLVYMPFAALTLVLFLIHERRSGVRWVLLSSLAAVALFFLIWIPFNWYGGGGFQGNRYFVNAYPGFLFLVTTLRPAWFTAIGYAAAGLLLGPTLMTPLGAPVPSPTLQAHTRNFPLRMLPLELDFRSKIPGYQVAGLDGLWFHGRKDTFVAREDELWIHGATPVELWMLSNRPLDKGVNFEVRNHAPGNALTLRAGGRTHRLRFESAPPRQGAVQRLEVPLPEPDAVLEGEKRPVYAYRLLLETETGFIPNAEENARTEATPVNEFYLGVAISPVADPNAAPAGRFELEWGDCEVPERVNAGELFKIATVVRNTGPRRWSSTGRQAIFLSYHWLDEQGEPMIWEGMRTPLPRVLAPGRQVRLQQSIRAPEEPGRYLLQLDPVMEKVSWFSLKNKKNLVRFPVEVTAPSG